ncbi:MAG TPA: DUF1153 domain-containing protein [Rhizomicrobium sp.]|nr:DUF1153 domain-containing protein [Rhizomicrobium sp.]
MGRDGRYFENLIVEDESESIAFSDLPLPTTKRWTPKLKATIVSAVKCGLLSLDDACDRYALSVDEFVGWQDAIEHYGLGGLRRRDIQEHRQHTN